MHATTWNSSKYTIAFYNTIDSASYPIEGECYLKVLQYSIAAPLVSSIGCRWGAAVLTADTPISSKGAFFQP